jgi:hypothetical protein
MSTTEHDLYKNSDPTILNVLQEQAQGMSRETYRQLFWMYSQIPNTPSRRSEKWIGLKSLGLDDEQIERMCKPVEYTREEMDKELARQVQKHKRELKKWNQQRREEAQLYNKQTQK